MEFHLKEAEKIEIVTLMDNYLDIFLKDSEEVKRPPLGQDGKLSKPLIAEHGLSFWIEVWSNERKRAFLFDAGMTSFGVIHNMDVLGLNLEEVEGIIISHGHPDHTASLLEILRKRIKKPLPIYIAPDAFWKRYLKMPGKERIELPLLRREPLIEAGALLQEERVPRLLADGTLLITGQIERKSSFEKAPSIEEIEIYGECIKDPIKDDQAVVMNLKGEGLVIVSGCAHSGIINTILYAQKLAEVKRVHAIIGGFHLTGPSFEPMIEKTVEELKNISPDIVVPTHCTGWKAMNQFSQEMPEQFVLNSVGTRIILGR